MTKSLIIIVGLSLCVCAFSWRRESINSYAPYCEARGTPRRLVEAPCDIEKNVYCTEPGTVYPRRAVRQFVSDNQGLMKRMYGDLRHLSVLRSEMEWNSEREQSFTIQRPNSVDDSESNATVANATSTSSPLDSNNSTSSNESSLTSRNQSEDSGWTTTSEKSPTEKGINACPTRQEVVAPYWAVNTRGRTLAIVNDPPYEQHIHWEKCLHENEQMLCRDGCRCEQQYRLQRLLAYDPTCDCKGVFMDWFLLPSCCVCKCYGLVYDTGENQNVSSGRRRGRNDEQTSKEIKVSSSNHSDINAENQYDVDYDV